MSAPCVPVHEATTLRVVTSGGFRFTESRYPPGYRIDVHRHVHAGLTFVLAGSMEERVGGRVEAMAAGSVLTKPPEETHHNRFGAAGAHCLIAEPSPARAIELEAGSGMLRQICRLGATSANLLARRLERELRSPDSSLPLLLESIVLETLAFGERGAGSGGVPGWLRRAIEYLDSCYTEPVRIEDAAAVAGVHPVHLARVFSAHAGVGPAEYVRQRRVEQAAMQLRDESESIAAIAVRCGFSDQSHLTRTFRRYFGTTPAAWRRAHAGQTTRGWLRTSDVSRVQDTND